MTYDPGVESRWGVDFIVGVDVPVVLPTSPISGVVLAAGLSAGGDGLPW
jgi:hypothetical protein